MRLPSQGAAVQMDGDFEPSDFSIEISAHAFSVLSKGLYSDPFRAIVRELCCNAWDAHVEAGTTDRPFELYLPNLLAPVFKIRDFGVGLSEMGIRKVYTSYFKSTKQQSDNMTGCFGLGSKSPYAYTRKFTIISYYNGMKYHYNAIINEKGFPQILKMAESETSEDNGLEISFSVNESDCYDFQKAARIALRPFVVKPIVKGLDSFKPDLYPEEDLLLEGKGWKLFSDLDGGNLCTMGNVEYPIEATRSGFSSNAKKVLGLALVIDFPLGSFEMTPSRESIQWTEFSVKNINDRLEQIYDEIVELVSKKIEDSKTLWEATLNTYKFVWATGLKELGISPLWKGKTVRKTIEIPSDKNITLFKFTAIEPKGKSNLTNAASVNKTTRVEPAETTFYLADFSGAEYRLGNYVRDHFTRGQHAYLVSVLDKAALKAFCNAVGISEKSLVNASTLPKRERSGGGGGGGGGGRRSRLAGSKARAFRLKASSSSGYSDGYWEEAEIDLEEPDIGVYVEISRWNPEGSQLGDKPQNLRYALNHLKDLGIAAPDGGVVGIKTAHKAKFEAEDNWRTFDAFVREKLIEYWTASSDFRYAYEYFQHVHYNERRKITDLRDLVKKMERRKQLSPESYLSRFTKTFDRLYKLEGQTRAFANLLPVLAQDSNPDAVGCMSLVLPHGHSEKNREDLYSKRVTARYPLLVPLVKSVSSYHWEEMASALAEYFVMMDERLANPRSPQTTSSAPETTDENNEE